MTNQYELRLCTHAKTVANVLNDRINYYDLTFVVSGQLKYKINGESYVLSAGDGICIYPGDQRYRFKAQEKAHYISVNFFPCDNKVNLPRFLPKCVNPELKSWLVKLHEATKNHMDVYSAETKHHLISLILINVENSLLKNTQNPHITAIIDYISKHYTEKITLEDISNAVNLTVPHCCHLIKKSLNMSIFQIILNERIILAKEYIIQGEYKLFEISKMCGFNDYGYFSKHFKKVTGVAPSQYLKHYNKSN